jgi:hypothetical protein
MAIDIKKMKAKLAALQNKGGGKTNFFKPEEGKKYGIRVVGTADGDPFKEFWFHYEIGKNSILCPKKNFQEECAICNFASKLYKENTEDSAKMAKKFLARQRFFSPIVVRGEEKDGVKIWGYGKNVYQDLINLVLNPDYGDICDPESGTDLSLQTGKAPGAQFPTTKLTPARNTSRLCQGTTEECHDLMESVPNFAEIHERKTSAEVSAALDEYLNASSTDAEAESASTETVKYGAKPTNAVDAAFADLMG